MNSNNFPGQTTHQAVTTPGPISWWANPIGNEFLPFITLQVDECGLLPSETTVRFDNGLLLRYVHPRPLNADYAMMPEALVNQQVEAFCDELTAAIEALDDLLPFRWLPLAFGVSAVLWLGLWLLWRWLV